MRRLLFVLAVGLLVTPATLIAQGPAWTQARRALQQGPGGTFEHNGYRMTGEPLTGALARGDSIDLPVELRSGAQYKLVGACDNACSDLNLVLFDPAGGQVDIDDIPDENCPIVTAASPQTGSYRLRVSLPGCSTATCRFGVAVYAK